jgi:hypothetical protein
MGKTEKVVHFGFGKTLFLAAVDGKNIVKLCRNLPG